MEWAEAQERLRGPIFAPFAAAIARLPAQRWPGHADLDALAEGLATASGYPLRFVPPRGPGDAERRHYEMRIAQSGEVETRLASWHDLFNALAWATWPRTKARINAQHAAMLEEGGAAEALRRSPERDALTLFDEGGVIVAASSAELLRLLADFEWKRLFWERRAEVEARMRFLAFGHACLEQALSPYIGMVAKTVFVPVDELFFMLPVEAQVARCDELAAAHFAERRRFASPKSMAPLPVLGVPGWHHAAQDEAFYDDASHFRSRPARA